MDARDQQEQITKVLYRSVMLALQREGDDWYEPVAKRARVLAHRLRAPHAPGIEVDHGQPPLEGPVKYQQQGTAIESGALGYGCPTRAAAELDSPVKIRVFAIRVFALNDHRLTPVGLAAWLSM